MDVFDLVAKISLDSSAFDKGLDESEQKASGFGSKLAGGFGSAASAVAGAAVDMGSKFAGGISNLAEYGDHIDKMSQKMGLSTDAYQEWEAVMQHSGTSMDAMKSSMKILASAAETGKDAFDKLGISQKDIAKMSQEELFEATIRALQNVSDETERTYLAGQLLGRGATELGALLNTSAEDTDAMRQRVHELGGVMSEEAVKSAAAYQDSLQDMQTAMQGIANAALAEFLPSITGIMDGIAELFSGDTEKGVGMISEGLLSVGEKIAEAVPVAIETLGQFAARAVEAIAEKLPEFLANGQAMIVNLLSGIGEKGPEVLTKVAEIVQKVLSEILINLPKFLENGAKAIINLVSGIKSAAPDLMSTIEQMLESLLTALFGTLPKMLEVGTMMLLELVHGIIEATPGLIDAAIEVVRKFLNFLREHLPDFLRTGLKMIGELAAGLIKAIPDLVKKIPTIIGKIVDAFLNFDWIGLGVDIVRGIIDGLLSMGKALFDALLGLLDDAVGGLLSWLGIASPSKLMRDLVGKNVALGMAEGIEKNAGEVESAMNDLADLTDIDSKASFSVETAGGLSTSGIGAAAGADLSSVMHELVGVLNAILTNGVDMHNDIELRGDASQIFQVVRRENNKWNRAYGYGL